MINTPGPSNKFSEIDLTALGLNIKLNDQLLLSDILQIELDFELRYELVKCYLNSVLPPEIIVFDQDPQTDHLDYICIFSDFSALISIKELKISVNRSKENFISFVHDKPKSYGIISITKSIVIFNKKEDLQTYLEGAVSILSLIKLKAELIGYIYKNTDLHARDLMKKCNEAKLLFNLDSRPSSIDSFNFSNKSFKRNISDDSWDTVEDRDSLYDYSISESKEKISGDIEDTDKAEISGENLNESHEYLESQTPFVSFKPFVMPIEQFKHLLKLQELNLESTRPLSYEYDKYSTEMIKFINMHASTRVGCYQCMDCIIA